MENEVKVKKEKAPKKAKGGKRTGRPVKMDSERQKRLAAIAARVESGEVIKRGRPCLSPEVIAERNAIKAATKAAEKATKAAMKAAKAEVEKPETVEN